MQIKQSVHHSPMSTHEGKELYILLRNLDKPSNHRHNGTYVNWHRKKEGSSQFQAVLPPNMGTSNENKRSTDEEEVELILPWAFVPYSVRIELIKKLNPDVAMSGNDWRMLASELGYTTGDINYIESEKDNNTAVLFKHYDTKAGASFNDVYRSLQRMQRHDCLDILLNALPEIQQAYNTANESQMLHPSPTTQVMAPMGQLQWPASYAYPHHATSPYGSHAACCSYSHNYTNYCATCPSHHLGACPSPYVVQIPHPHYTVRPSLSHLDTAQKTFDPSFSPPHHSMPLAHGCLAQPQPSCHISVTQPLGSGSPSCIARHGTLESSGHGGFSPGHSSIKGSPVYSPNENVSSITLPNNISALDNSNLISNGSSNSSNGSFNGQNIVRQDSTESNVSQALNEGRRQRNNSRETLDSRDSLGQYCATLLQDNDRTAKIGCRPINGHEFADNPDKVNDRERYCFHDCEAKVQNGVREVSDKWGHNSSVAWGETRTGLALVGELAIAPGRFKPTPEYRPGGAENKIAMDKPHTQGHTPGSPSVSHNNRQPPAPRNQQPNLASRVRVNPDPSMEEFESSPEPTMPINASNVDNKKALRNIEVFVTYSYDSQDHGKQVLSLCKFLQKNRFGCSVDIRVKKSLGRSLEKLEWCKEKMIEADFILICISQKYLEDISSVNSSFISQNNERQLHTREIYELLNYEYLNNQHSYGQESRNSNSAVKRFVPLLFPNMTQRHVPPCMRNGQAISWPEDYKNLFKRLIKSQVLVEETTSEDE